MKLPLYVHCNSCGNTLVVDAEHKILLSVKDAGFSRKFAHDVVRKMNRNWRYVLFGQQPYVYTREDWLYGKAS